MGQQNSDRSAHPLLDELGELLKRGQKYGLKGLSAEELARLDELYRWATVYLAQLRGKTVNRTLLDRVNAMVTRAHSFIYIAPRKNTLHKTLSFYWVGFSSLIVRTAKFHLVSFALFTAGLLLAHFTFSNQVGAAYALMPESETRLPGSSPEQLENSLRGGRDMSSGNKMMFSSFLFTHNTKVGILAFASGVLGGIPTVFLMFLNGAILGTFTSIHTQNGIGAEMFAWLLPHGITEILAILLCGGAGLMLGSALLRPGSMTRKQSLKKAGKDAILIFMGVVPMFFAAGLIEGFLRQSHMDTPSRLLFAGATAVFWVIYFTNGYALNRRMKPTFENKRANQGEVHV